MERTKSWLSYQHIRRYTDDSSDRSCTHLVYIQRYVQDGQLAYHYFLQNVAMLRNVAVCIVMQSVYRATNSM